MEVPAVTTTDMITAAQGLLADATLAAVIGGVAVVALGSRLFKGIFLRLR